MEHKITHQNYKNCLINSRITLEAQVKIQSEAHQIFTQKFNKIALTPFDDKGFLYPDDVSSYAYGHVSTAEVDNTWAYHTYISAHMYNIPVICKFCLYI